jgi:hypothetical protein
VDDDAALCARSAIRLERCGRRERHETCRQALDGGGKGNRKTGRGKQRHGEADPQEEQDALENRRHLSWAVALSLKLGMRRGLYLPRMGDGR